MNSTKFSLNWIGTFHHLGMCPEHIDSEALLRLGQSDVMLNAGGLPSSARRREFDLYTHVDDADALRTRVDGKAEIVEDLHDTFYGMREFVVRDCNGFWITFGQPAPSK